MPMALSWSMRRQLLYYIVAGVACLIILVAGWKTFFTHTPTCNDGLKNGTELGVDCGGSCALICQAQARAPVVSWARAFKTDTGLYTAAAYIENSNPGAGARAVRYSFQLFDDKNVLVIEREGVADLPNMVLVPIVESNITVGNRVVARTLFSFADEPEWSRVPEKKPSVVISNQELEQDGSRISATLTNNSLENIKQLVVIAVLFDAQGIARGASKSTVSTIAKKSSQPVVFTWPTGVPNIVRAEITVVPAL
ncbi:MAG: Uncharacterized protein G01um101456_450 [Parcubacteria group bacterium Gr01-1014_56]|nr:MAG: Uncharacterized protein G01um101456_450 [Parcubacteria group bacterium Gr01-1014_56]